MTNHNWYDPNHGWQQEEHYNQPQTGYSRYSRISIDDAMSIALERVPGEVVKAELDRENGVLVYEIEIINHQGVEYEVEVEAHTGRVIKVKRD